MVAKLFVDTWGWLTLHDKGENQHKEVVEFYQQFRAQKGEVYTTDYVLDETFTLLFKRLSPSQAQTAMETLLAAFNYVTFHLIWITEERFSQTTNMRLKYLDKPQISFTDLTSMVVMSEFSIISILSGDAHFTQVGLNFERLP